MNYTVLYIRLNSYASDRAKKGSTVEEADFDTTTKKEMIATIVFTLAIMAFPILISILLWHNHYDFDHDVIKTWERYQFFYMMNIIVITILLVVSTLTALRHMRKIFG